MTLPTKAVFFSPRTTDETSITGCLGQCKADGYLHPGTAVGSWGRWAAQRVRGSEAGVFTADAGGYGGLGASSVARLEIPPEVILACLLQGWGAQAALSPGAAQHCLPQHSSQLKKQDLKNCSC